MSAHAGRIYPGPTTEKKIGKHSPGFLQPLKRAGLMGYGPGEVSGFPKGRHAPGFLLGLGVGTGKALTGEIIRGPYDDTAIIYQLAEYGSEPDSAREFEALADTQLVVVRGCSGEFDTFLSLYRQVEWPADVLLSVTRHLSEYADVLLIIRDGSGDGSGETRLYKAPSDRVLEFLGKGLRFPFTFQRRSGGAQISTATSADHAHIHESIRQILGTRKGERLLRPEFGTRLHELVFEPNDHILYGLIRHEVADALQTWEPRILITDVLIYPDANSHHTVLVDIRYRLISTQVEANIVWPFYRELE